MANRAATDIPGRSTKRLESITYRVGPDDDAGLRAECAHREGVTRGCTPECRRMPGRECLRANAARLWMPGLSMPRRCACRGAVHAAALCMPRRCACRGAVHAAALCMSRDCACRGVANGGCHREASPGGRTAQPDGAGGRAVTSGCVSQPVRAGVGRGRPRSLSAVVRTWPSCVAENRPTGWSGQPGRGSSGRAVGSGAGERGCSKRAGGCRAMPGDHRPTPTGVTPPAAWNPHVGDVRARGVPPG
ncbi:hypothetical protein LY12_000217 [Prauserella alba]|nr:hypothetical protein [Prauserella alba]